jgi:hypothetical protein
VKFWIGIISKENLYKVQGLLARPERVESPLWKGQVDAGLAEFEGCTAAQIENFNAYLQSHRHHIPKYDYLKAEGARLAQVRSNLPSSK